MSVKYDSHEFHEGLAKHGLIVPVGVPGVFGRGAVFEDVLERFNGLVSDISRNDGAEVYTFPPVINRQVLEKVHYLDSFPHLCGAVYSFFETDTARTGMGNFVVLWLIDQCKRMGLPYVYLGYWIADSAKMAYKARFQPLESLGPEGWARLNA